MLGNLNIPRRSPVNGNTKLVGILGGVAALFLVVLAFLTFATVGSGVCC